MLAATVPVATGTAHAADQASTNQTEIQARKEFAAGRFDKALELFAALYAETLHPVYLRNIGRCHQKMREPQKAIDAFKDYLAKAPKTGKEKVTADERAEIEGYIKEMELLRDEQARAATPVPPVTPVTPLPPGQPVAQTPPPAVTPPANEPPPPSLVTTAPPPESASAPIYKRWWFWTGLGVLVVGGVVAAVVLSGDGGKPPCPTGVVCN
jgi:hypothetical protein